MKINPARAILTAFGVLFVLAAILGAAAWHTRDRVRHEAIELKFTDASTPRSVSVGETVQEQFELLCPWGQVPVRAEADWAEGFSGGREIIPEKTGLLWGKCRYRVLCRAAAYRPGEYRSVGRVSIFYRGVPSEQIPESAKVCELPAVTVKPLELTGTRELALADTLQPPEHANLRLLWWIVPVAVLLTALLGMWLRRRERRSMERSPWEIAEYELDLLRRQVAGHPELVPRGVVRLSDIVREYLDRRFQWKSTRQTAPEFLRELTRADSPLSGEQRSRLKNFVNAAELVKFAGAKPAMPMLENAIDEACALVAETGEPEIAETTEEEYV